MTEAAPTLLEEIEEALAQSLLIFLVADFRILSATGRVRTQYEAIAVDSDYCTRTSARELAGLTTTESSKIKEDEGISPAQIMAVLLLELQQSVSNNRTTGEEDFAMGDSATKKKRGGGFEDDMHSLLKAYAHMVGSDLNDKVPHIEARRSVLDIDVNFDIDTAPSMDQKQQDDGGEEVKEPEGDEDDALDTEDIVHSKEDDVNQSASSAPHGRSRESLLKRMPTVRVSALQAPQLRRGTVLMNSATRDQQEMQEVTDAVFNMGEYESVRQSIHSDPKVSLTKTEMRDVMQRAVDSRVYGRLGFMAKFFRNGTVSQLMIKSKAKVVWMNDWYPATDLTYAVAVDKEKKRVLVVFRGCKTSSDWKHSFDYNLTKVPNPIQEDFEDKPSMISFHQGFYQYLFRVRKDTNTKKYDEIANIAHKYGMEDIGQDYNLVVTGHSLGAALSTVFSFYASTDERFTRNGPIKVFTCGSPYVGGHTFADSFRHQEFQRKIQYARFYNHNDFVAHVPANMGFSERGSTFRHVGIGVRVPEVPWHFVRFRKWRPKVYYIGKEKNWCTSYMHGIKRNFLLHSPMIWRIAKMHKLEELQKRLMYGKMLEERKDENKFELLHKPLDEVYEILAGVKKPEAS